MQDFTKGREWTQILNFAIPMVLGNLFMQLYQFVDTAIVGRFVGKEALAAVGASTPVIFMTIALIIGIGIGGSIVSSQYFGVKQYDKVQASADTMLVFMMGAGVVVTAVGLLFSRPILGLMMLPEALMPMATQYLQIYFAGSILLFGFNTIAAVLRGVGDSKTPLYFLIVSSVLNVVLDLVFIIVFGWGVAGAAWATVISQGVAFVLGVVYVNRRHELIRFNIFHPRFDRQIFRQSLRLGLPSGIQQTFVAVGMVAVMGVVNGFGTDVIAAFSAVNRIDTFVAIPVMNVAAALTSVVGQNAGAGKYIRIRRGLRDTLILSSVCCLALNAVMILFGRHLLGVFTDDAAVIDLGYELMVVINSTYLIFNIMFVVNGMLRGAGATVFPMFTTILSLWLCRLPAAILLSKAFGAVGIWWSMPVGWLIGMIGAVAYYYSGRWRGKSVVRRVPVAETENY